MNVINAALFHLFDPKIIEKLNNLQINLVIFFSKKYASHTRKV